MDAETNVGDCPERTLWLAVIEKAIKDYCFFFDKLSGGPSDSLIGHYKMSSRMYRKCVIELNRLHWFLFTKECTPWNLQYLVTILYENPDDVLACIRTAAREQFARHLAETELKNTYPQLILYIKNNTTAATHKSAPTESKLRYKRYRLNG